MSPFKAIVRVLLFLGLLNSCSQLSYVFRWGADYEGIHPHLKDTISEVNRLSKGCLGNLKYAGFREFQKDSVVGMANWILPKFDPQININPKYWYKLNHRQKLILIAHELYHAEKPFLGHIKELDEWGCAEHLMYPTMQSNWCDIIKFEKYVKQMGDCHE